MASNAQLYDGESAVRHDVALEVVGDGIILIRPDGASEHISFHALKLRERSGDWVRVSHRDRQGWRLIVEGEAARPLAAQIRPAHGIADMVDRMGLVPMILSGAAAVALIAFVVVNIVDWIVVLTPDSFIEDVGDRVSNLIVGGADNYCEDETAEAALAALAARLYPIDDFEEVPKIRVGNTGLVNAFAAPGGQIVILRGLIEEAKTSDELAGVLAHEMGHVKHRHATRALARALGLGFLIQTMGGNVGATADTFLALRNSRGYEREADEETLGALRRASISPAGLARFFARMDEEYGLGDDIDRWLDYVSTHPALGDRAEAFAAAVDDGAEYRPALTKEEWKALSGMCKS